MALKTETNTPEMEERVLEAFLVSDACGEHTREEVQVDFEHGQWWITVKPTGAQWSVNDAEGHGSIDGFSFEQVTEGDDA